MTTKASASEERAVRRASRHSLRGGDRGIDTVLDGLGSAPRRSVKLSAGFVRGRAADELVPSLGTEATWSESGRPASVTAHAAALRQAST